MPNPFAAIGAVVVAALGAPAAISVSRASGTYDAASGVWDPGTASVFTVDAHVQPAGPRDLRMLPENERTIEAITIFTIDALHTSDVASGQMADVVTWSGRTWRVRAVEDWNAQARYFKSVAQREGE